MSKPPKVNMAELGITLAKLEGEIARRGRCVVCKGKYSDLDKKMTNSRPQGVCVACFTNNA